MTRRAAVVLLALLLACLDAARDALASGCLVPSFAAARTFDVGGSFAMVVADFDGDGKADLAAATGLDVAVLLSKGDGTFQTAVNYDAGTRASSIAVADFNGDGKRDLAVANTTFLANATFPGTVSVLLGKGDGTFQHTVSYTASEAFWTVAVGDFNGDGKPDLALGGLLSGAVSVLLGNGDGTLQTAVQYGVVPGPGTLDSVAVGDFNDDGRPDLAVAVDGRGVWVLSGNGDGTFQPAVSSGAGSSARSIAVGDFNGDGWLDLAVAASPSSSVSVLLGTGKGTFQAAVSYSVGRGPVSVVVGDFNGDTKPDLAVANQGEFGGANTIWEIGAVYNASVSVLLGKGDGTFQAAVSYGAETKPYSLVVADFNGDGKPDLAAGSSISRTVSVLLGKGDGAFQSAVQQSAGTNPVFVSIGELNGDGKPDLVVANSGRRELVQGAFGLVPVGWSDSSVSVLLGNGDGSFKAAVSYGQYNASSVAVGDFNGDAKADLAVVNSQGFPPRPSYGTVSVLLDKGEDTFQATPRDYAGNAPRSVVAGDFNNDGKLDLALANQDGPDLTSGKFISGGISLLLGKGDGTFQSAIVLGAGSNPESIVVGDFNRDGRPDLAVANKGQAVQTIEIYTNGNVSVLLGKGDGTFQTAVNYAAGKTPRSVAVGDFNSDGQPDLVVANSGYYDPLFPDISLGASLSLLLGQADGTFQAAVNLDLAWRPGSVAVGDFNSDGQPDLAVTNLSSRSVALLLGKGDGTFQGAVSYAAGSLLGSMAVGDLNGDGKSDLAVANSDGVVVLLNTCVSADIALAIVRSGPTVIVSWPFPSTGFLLESATSLSPANWRPARDVPRTNAARLEVVVPVGAETGFFRLHKP